MKKSREYKMSVVLFSVSLVLYTVSMVTGLIPEITFSIDKICMYLGFAFFGTGLVFSEKASRTK